MFLISILLLPEPFYDTEIFGTFFKNLNRCSSVIMWNDVLLHIPQWYWRLFIQGKRIPYIDNFILTASFEGSNRKQDLIHQKFFKKTWFHTIVTYVIRSSFQNSLIWKFIKQKTFLELSEILQENMFPYHCYMCDVKFISKQLALKVYQTENMTNY